MSKNILPFKRAQKCAIKPSGDEPTLSVEGTIHQSAKDTFAVLEVLIQQPNKQQDPRNTYTVYSQLLGLTKLKDVKHHGLSHHLIVELYQIEEKALALMHIHAGIEE